MPNPRKRVRPPPGPDGGPAVPPPASRPEDATTSSFEAPRRRTQLRRTPFKLMRAPMPWYQRYLCEVCIFMVALTCSLLYGYLSISQRQSVEEILPERRKFRMWDWPAKHELMAIRDQWHHAVATIVIPGDLLLESQSHDTRTETGRDEKMRHRQHTGKSEDVSFQYSMGNEHKLGPDEPGHIPMPEFFLDYDVYGVLAWHPADDQIQANITAYNKQAHIDLLADMKIAVPAPDHIFELDVENRGRGLELGWAAVFSNLRSRRERDDIESQMRLLARMYGQVAMYKWWAHQYGPDPRKDVSIIQEIMPTAAATWDMKTSGAVYRVRYEHRLLPYQEDGEYQHTPRQRLPQADNTRVHRRRKHAKWVKDQVRKEEQRREEKRKMERRERERSALFEENEKKHGVGGEGL